MRVGADSHAPIYAFSHGEHAAGTNGVGAGGATAGRARRTGGISLPSTSRAKARTRTYLTLTTLVGKLTLTPGHLLPVGDPPR